jgi:hypothetical protein
MSPSRFDRGLASYRRSRCRVRSAWPAPSSRCVRALADTLVSAFVDLLPCWARHPAPTPLLHPSPKGLATHSLARRARELQCTDIADGFVREPDALLSAPQPVVVLEAVALTAAIVGGLTAYSFYATRTGKDFRCAANGISTPVAVRSVHRSGVAVSMLLEPSPPPGCHATKIAVMHLICQLQLLRRKCMLRPTSFSSFWPGAPWPC